MKIKYDPANELKMMISKQGEEIRRLQTIITEMERDAQAISKILIYYTERNDPQNFIIKFMKKIF